MRTRLAQALIFIFFLGLIYSAVDKEIFQGRFSVDRFVDWVQE